MEVKRVSTNQFRDQIARHMQDVREGKHVIMLQWWREDVLVLLPIKEWERLKEKENANS